jgi:PilX N-terminal
MQRKYIAAPPPDRGFARGLSARDQNGAALIVVLLLTALLFALGAFGTRAAQLELLIAGNDLQARRALEVAQAGLDHAFSLIREVDAAGRNEAADGFDDELASGGTGGALAAIGATVVVDGASYRFRHFGGSASGDGYYVRALDDYDETAGLDDAATDANFRIQLVSVGRVGRAERVVHAVVERDPTFACALCGKSDLPILPGDVAIVGALRIDSFDSRLGAYDPLAPGANGNVISNGDVSMVTDLLGLLPIDVRGNVVAHRTIVQTGAVNVTGAVTQFASPIEFPAVPPCGPPYPANDGISGGLYDRALGTLVNIGVNDVIDLAPGDYCFSSIVMTGASTLRGNGAVRIFLTAPSVILGLVNTTNAASNLRLYSSVTSPASPPIVPGLTLAGTAEASAAIYAPDAIVTFAGLNDFYGSVVAAVLPDIGIGGVHYDEALENPAVRMVSWSEERNDLPD